MKKNGFSVIIILVFLIFISSCQKTEDKETKTKPIPPAPAAVPALAPVPSTIAPSAVTSVVIPEKKKPELQKIKIVAEKKVQADIEKSQKKEQEKTSAVKDEGLKKEGEQVARLTPPEKTVPETTVLLAAPAFTLSDTESNQVSLQELRGKVVLLNFTAIWCPPCRNFVPHAVFLLDKFGDRGFTVISIFVGKQEMSKVQEYVKNNNINYRALIDDGSMEAKYNIKAVPYFIIVDKKGRIVKKGMAGLKDDVIAELTKDIEALL